MLKDKMIEVAAGCGGKDVAIRYSSETKSWYSDIGGAHRGSSTDLIDGPYIALEQAFENYTTYKEQ